MKTLNNLLLSAAMLLIAVSAFAQPHGNRPRTGITNPGAHDPVMIKADGAYYVFSTGWNVGVMTSTDLKTWDIQNPALDKTPEWAINSVPDYRGHTWAPDIVEHNGKYHLFYSCSSFGKNSSAIGHAVADKLSPDSTKWHDTGAVIRSIPGETDWNAIDPAVNFDEKGNAWMTWGSFWGGIQLVQLNKDLTAPLHGAQQKTIAKRRQKADLAESDTSSTHAIEAPFIFKHGGWYYLFVSWDFCCRGDKSTYRVVCGRSRTIDGDYKDRDGRKMIDGGGTPVCFRSDRYVASGHCSAYTFDGKDYFLCHGYLHNDRASELVVREMKWDKDGWPIVEL